MTKRRAEEQLWGDRHVLNTKRWTSHEFGGVEGSHATKCLGYWPLPWGQSDCWRAVCRRVIWLKLPAWAESGVSQNTKIGLESFTTFPQTTLAEGQTHSNGSQQAGRMEKNQRCSWEINGRTWCWRAWSYCGVCLADKYSVCITGSRGK